MLIRVSEIPDEGLTIANVGEFVAPFTDRAWRLDHIRLQVVREGVDVIVTGELQATVPMTCGRCLEELPAAVRAVVDARYIPRPATADDVELGADDLDLDFYDDDQLDLARLVETETSLALPMKPLCRDDCRGLCPVCGGNRNVTACACSDRSDDDMGGSGRPPSAPGGALPFGAPRQSRRAPRPPDPRMGPQGGGQGSQVRHSPQSVSMTGSLKTSD
jgi:uncharacterized protein